MRDILNLLNHVVADIESPQLGLFTAISYTTSPRPKGEEEGEWHERECQREHEPDSRCALDPRSCADRCATNTVLRD